MNKKKFNKVLFGFLLFGLILLVFIAIIGNSMSKFEIAPDSKTINTTVKNQYE